MDKRPISYKDAGVDTEAADAAIARIADAAKRTYGPGVLAGIGGFGGLFALKDALEGVGDPILVSGTDGVGTKLLVAKQAGRHDTIGQDLVAMCANDVLTLGARPLFFLDYFACGVLDPEQLAEVVIGIARACEEIGCALLGGETAELSGMYPRGEYDLAGFVVGAVDRSRVVDGKAVRPGDAIVGLASTGLHSNGYSLARRVVFERLGKSIDDPLVDGKSVADVLLEPTALYVTPVLGLLENDAPIRAMAHITGGGLPGNLTRGFPEGTAAVIDPSTWEEPAVFDVLRQGGPVEEDEMRRTFNLGIGYCLVVPKPEAEGVVGALAEEGVAAEVIGEVVEGEGEVRFVEPS